MIDVQSYIIFLCAAFFTALYLNARRSKEFELEDFLGLVASACWMILGFLWLFLASEQSGYGTYAIGLLFNGIGIMMIILIIIERLRMKSLGRHLDGDPL